MDSKTLASKMLQAALMAGIIVVTSFGLFLGDVSLSIQQVNAQAVPTDQQTVNAAVKQLFTQTAQAEPQIAITQTVQTAFDQALTATALSIPQTRDGSETRPLLNPCTNLPFHTIMTGAGIETAQAGIDGVQQSQWIVNFTLAHNQEALDFDNHTKTHIGQPLAIVLDGKVLTAPTIQAEMTTGGEIRGNFTQRDAQDLALQLQSGALPAPLHVQSTDKDSSGNGSRIILASDDPNVTTDLLAQDRQIIERRLNSLNVSPASVQVLEGGQIAVQIPAVSDPVAVIEAIQHTGLLEFVDFSPTGGCTASMPAAGQYILTDKQITLKSKQATPAATSQ